MRKAQADDADDQNTELKQIGICDHAITSLRGRNNRFSSSADENSISYIIELCQFVVNSENPVISDGVKIGGH